MAKMKPSPQARRSSAIGATPSATIATRRGTTNRTVGPKGGIKKVSVLLGETITTAVPTTAGIETVTTAGQIAIVAAIAMRMRIRPTPQTLKLGPL